MKPSLRSKTNNYEENEAHIHEKIHLAMTKTEIMWFVERNSTKKSSY